MHANVCPHSTYTSYLSPSLPHKFSNTRSVHTHSSGYKLVILDEADAMSKDAQFALRRVIEKYTKNTRFCLICNYVNKIIPALQSRCTRFRFGPLQKEQITVRMRYIAEQEGVNLTDDGMDQASGFAVCCLVVLFSFVVGGFLLQLDLYSIGWSAHFVAIAARMRCIAEHEGVNLTDSGLVVCVVCVCVLFAVCFALRALVRWKCFFFRFLAVVLLVFFKEPQIMFFAEQEGVIEFGFYQLLPLG